MKISRLVSVAVLLLLVFKLKAGETERNPHLYPYELDSTNSLTRAIIKKQPDSQIIQLLNATNKQALNIPDSYGQLPFIAALIKGNSKVINAFLKRYVDLDLNREDEVYDPYTPLAAAIITGNSDIINWLIIKKIDINKKFGHFKGTALIRALREILFPFSDINYQKLVTGVRALLFHKALQDNLADIVNMKDKYNNTALHVIASKYNGYAVEIMKLLVDAGADPQSKNDKGRTPEELIEGQQTAVKRVVLSYASTNPIIRAILKGESEKTILNLATQPATHQYINKPDSAGKTPLVEAIGKAGTPEFIKKFVAKGVRIEADKDGITPLAAAIIRGYEEIVRWLLYDIKVNVNEPVKETIPLILAVESRPEPNAKLVQLLLEKGAQVDMQDNAGATALIYAVQQYWQLSITNQLKRDIESFLKNSIKLLIKYGANPDIEDRLGNSAETYAQRVPALAKILEEAKKQPVETTQMLANKLSSLAYNLMVLRSVVRA